MTAASWTRPSRLHLALFATALALTGLAARPSPSGPAHSPALDPALRGLRGAVSLIVQKSDSADRAPEAFVRAHGGSVTRDLPIINGFAAKLSAEQIDELARISSVRVLTLDRRTVLHAAPDDSKLKSVYPKVVKADAMWRSGFTGLGVTVALIDTGIADVADLAGRVLPIHDDVRNTDSPCVNMSGEAGCDDSYGHGTFIAGMIAGDGTSSGGSWTGVAPEASLVSIKIAGRSGATDVSTIIAAIQWTVSFQDRYGIRVVNLSLGTDGTQSYRTDPLNYAVERAWDSGLVVVVSASNRGPSPATISKPGDDPLVITVGAIDDVATVRLGDDTVPDFSSRGPTAADGLAKPDVVAPGSHVISLRAPGSEIDTRFPTYVDGSYRKGSGTSMATGVVSGGVALLLQADPSMTPDRVKYALTSTARRPSSGDPFAIGSGWINVSGARTAPAGLANQDVPRSTGSGSLDLSRGTVQFQASDPLATVVQGTLTAQLLAWDPLGLTAAWTGGSWYGGSWYGGSWYGGSWYGGSWYGGSWYGGSWYGGSWYGVDDVVDVDGGSWYGEPTGGSWYGGSWYGGSWYGGSWYGAWE